jgi:hypothetical protein
MTFRVIGALAFLAVISVRAEALPAQASWPPPTCEKPDDKVLRMRPGNDADAVMAYNARVHRYNRMSAAFTDCSKAYVEGVNREIDQVRARAQQHTREIVDRANARIHAIEAQVNAAVAVGNGGTAPAIANPDPDFPLAACERPVQTAPDYAARRRAFETRTRDYIDRGKAAMQQAKDDADKSQQQVTADANRRIQLLNTLAQQAADGANDEARKTAAMLDAQP